MMYCLEQLNRLTSLDAPFTQSRKVKTSDLHGTESATSASLVTRLAMCDNRPLNAIVDVNVDSRISRLD